MQNLLAVSITFCQESASGRRSIILVYLDKLRACEKFPLANIYKTLPPVGLPVEYNSSFTTRRDPFLLEQIGRDFT